MADVWQETVVVAVKAAPSFVVAGSELDMAEIQYHEFDLPSAVLLLNPVAPHGFQYQYLIPCLYWGTTGEDEMEQQTLERHDYSLVRLSQQKGSENEMQA
mmetsp:Transcript_7402/g.12000  ORF Transcript_7402/g.12000 Transcript_7402/m.12000 type:complete len:100 (-) Transcript_7402:306-605(-)